jgi:hypothetical protein
MATVTIQKFHPFQETNVKVITGSVTGKTYGVDQLGRATIDTADAPRLLVEGWAYWQPGPGGGGATSGTTLIDFGAFPGSAWAQTAVAAVDVRDPNAIVNAWILPAATADHSIDEHIIDPPLVSAYADGSGNIVITGVPRFTPPSPIPPDPMPYGKWNVGWAFSP